MGELKTQVIRDLGSPQLDKTDKEFDEWIVKRRSQKQSLQNNVSNFDTQNTVNTAEETLQNHFSNLDAQNTVNKIEETLQNHVSNLDAQNTANEIEETLQKDVSNLDTQDTVNKTEETLQNDGSNSDTQDTVNKVEEHLQTQENLVHSVQDFSNPNGNNDKNVREAVTGSPPNENRTESAESEQEIPCLGIDNPVSPSKLSNVLIWGTVLKQPIKFLVDTGAAVTVVSDTFYADVLRAQFALKPNDRIDNVKTANGHTVSVTGLVSFPAILGDAEYSIEASVVPGLAYNVVLGRDLLHRLKAVIDVGGEVVTFSGTNLIPFATGDQPPLVSEVRVAHTQVIEGHTEAVIPAYLSSFSSAPVIGLIEAVPKLSGRYHLLAASSLSSPDEEGRVTFRLLNHSDIPVLLYKGTTIGTFVESSPTDLVTSFELESDVAVLDQSPPPGNTGSSNEPLLSKFQSLPSPALSENQNAELNDVLRSYSDIFASSSLDLGHTSVVTHKIDTGDARPIKQAAYRVSQPQRVEIEKHISNMLDQDIISVSSSPWSSPVVLVKKKDGTTRFCVDYRKLNAVTRKDSFPLPRIDDALDALSGSSYFTTLDLQSGYHQVAMDPSSKDKTAFITHAGLYEFNVMSFGLTNAPPDFQRLMSRVLHGLEWKTCLIYIDDIIIFSSSFEEHLNRLCLVFSRLREAGLKLKPSKCHFARNSVAFLGFVVSSEGILPDLSKLDAVRSFPKPSCVKDVRSFLGLCNYYRRFVHGFAKIASPLNHLTRKQVDFVWSPECEKAFQELKERLCSPPVLAYPDFSQPFHLYTDASQHALGYVLGQIREGREHVIAYGGRELNVAEKNYSTTEREALAVVEGIKRYQPYLSGKHFLVHTDHGSLSWLMNVKDPTGRLARWALQLQQYDFEIVHRPGTSNGNADALSRRPYRSSSDEPRASSEPQTSSVFPVVVIEPSCPQAPSLHTLQRQDQDLAAIINYLETSQLPESTSQARKLMLTIDSYYLDEHGILCHLWSPGKRHVHTLCAQVVIPASLRSEILVSCHDDPTAGHLSTLKTYEKIRSRYYWHGMYQDIDHWCRSCVDCAMKKVPRGQRRAPLLPIPVEGAFDRVAMDILGPFPTTVAGNRYIIVFSDYYTRWPEAFALPSVEAPRIAQLIVDEILARHGAPRTLLSDRGPNFLAAIVKEVCLLMNTRRLHTTSYHPQTDGLVERFNGTLAEGLSMYVSTHQKDWDNHLPMILFAYRVSANATTRESPFYLLYGREPRLPIDVALLLPASANLSCSVAEHRARIVSNLENAQRIIASNTQLAQQQMKAQYDKTSASVPYNVGSRVWVYTPKARKGLSKKLTHNYHGPYRIVAKLSPVHFKLQTLDNRAVSVPVHANRMKPYIDPDDRPIDPPVEAPSTPDLADGDLPEDSFWDDKHPAIVTARVNSTPKDTECDPNFVHSNLKDNEPSISRPEDIHSPLEIKNV